MSAVPAISVVIPTRDRAALLRESLSSLVDQTLGPDEYEVIVIDDGSRDDTSAICAEMARHLRLAWHRIAPSGISAAKNLGIFAAKAPVVLFFDDDDVAHQGLLSEHVRMHRVHADPAVAVLGRTEWAPWLEVTELMRYVTDVGKFLFDYSCISDGDELDYRWFWGGRSSCKRMLLAREGIFDPEFRFGSEDIELAYRLRRHGFRVVYDARAISFMNRTLTHQEFCSRAERQGWSQHHFGVLLHGDDGAIRKYCGVDGAVEEWERLRLRLDAQMARARELEVLVTAAANHPDRSAWVTELHDLYGATIRAHNLRGLAEATSRSTQVAA